jgi:hypothetical protein
MKSSSKTTLTAVDCAELRTYVGGTDSKPLIAEPTDTYASGLSASYNLDAGFIMISGSLSSSYSSGPTGSTSKFSASGDVSVPGVLSVSASYDSISSIRRYD